jgi:hypothetical protein
VHGALAGLYEGNWARGRASWPRNPATCASAHAPVHGEREGGRADRAGPWRRERRKGCVGATVRRLVIRARKTERKRARGRRKTGADRSAPAGKERERERGGEGNCRLVGRLGCFLFSFFSRFSNSFSISFSIGFSNPNSN